jgi:hypothetical protein
LFVSFLPSGGEHRNNNNNNNNNTNNTNTASNVDLEPEPKPKLERRRSMIARSIFVENAISLSPRKPGTTSGKQPK